MASKEFTLSEVSEHTAKKDLYIIVHDKVYDASSFVDEHPGGEEVLLDVGGQDSTEAFEDVGHSDEAREILEGLLVGTVKRQPGDAPAKSHSHSTQSSTADGSSGIGLYAVIFIGGALAFVAWKYLEAQKQAVGQ